VNFDSFDSFELSPALMNAIVDQGYLTPTEIQSKAIPLLLKTDNDFVGQAQTGTGKTAAFLLPLLERLDYKSKKVQAIILTPTRELAHQVNTELEKFGRHVKIRSLTVYGGVPYAKQIRDLKDQIAQIVVGTPGRVIDLLERGVLKLENCAQLIIDEADEMLNMGFLEDVQTIMGHLPENRRLWMFSATLPRPIQSMIEKNFRKPEVLKIKSPTLSNASIDQFYCLLNRRDFVRGLRVVCQSLKECYAIVFCETREDTKSIAESMINSGISAMALHGDLNQTQRDYAMKKFKDKKTQILVCTDVAARGIDVSHVTHVINIGIPRQKENYVHRIGRTGRAGQKGTSISFVSPADMHGLRMVERLTGQKIQEYKLPKAKELKFLKILNELSKMDLQKEAILKKGSDFTVDESFASFENYLKDLTKDQMMKLFFSYHFGQEIKQIEDELNLAPASSPRYSDHGRRGGSSSSGNRPQQRGGGNRSRVRRDYRR
jgi:ATP-dependent RNA helicase DeaD